MLVALTGTPGTGKSTVAEALSAQGHAVLEVNDLAKRHGLLRSKDLARDSYDLDLDEVQEALEREGFADGVLVGHLSHLLDVDMVIVLRCHPDALARRLEARGWPAAKVRENALAEALDVILGGHGPRGPGPRAGHHRAEPGGRHLRGAVHAGRRK